MAKPAEHPNQRPDPTGVADSELCSLYLNLDTFRLEEDGKPRWLLGRWIKIIC